MNSQFLTEVSLASDLRLTVEDFYGKFFVKMPGGYEEECNFYSFKSLEDLSVLSGRNTYSIKVQEVSKEETELDYDFKLNISTTNSSAPLVVYMEGEEAHKLINAMLCAKINLFCECRYESDFAEEQ